VSLGQLSQLNAKLRARIQTQIAAEDASLAARVVGPGTAQSPQPDGRGKGQDCLMASPARGVGYRVAIIQCRRRCLDEHDSLRFAVKALVDEITRFLGFTNDNDPYLIWEYSQHETRGPEGTIVIIHKFDLI